MPAPGVFRGAGAGLIMMGDGRYCAGWRGMMRPLVTPPLSARCQAAARTAPIARRGVRDRIH